MQYGNFNKINVDSGNRKRERFNFSRGVSTTCGFGECQPAQVKLCIPNSKHTCSVESVVRTSPMVAPTYGDMRLKTWHSFVAMSDLLHSFAPFLSGQPYGSAGGVRKQSKMPSMKLSHLAACCLIGAKITVYYQINDNDHYAYEGDPETDGEARWWLLDPRSGEGMVNQLMANINVSDVDSDARFPGYSGLMFGAGTLCPMMPFNLLPCGNLQQYSNEVDGVAYFSDFFGDFEDTVVNPLYSNRHVPIDSADYCFVNQIGIMHHHPEGEEHDAWPLNTRINLMFAVRLSSFGKRLRKVLLGAGYQVNFYSQTEVNLLPLFAYYKAYFDSFGLCLYNNYESSNANVLLKKYDAGENLLDLGNATFMHFISDLANCYVTDDVDFVAAHQRTDAVSVENTGFINNIVLDPNYAGTEITDNISQRVNPDEQPMVVRDVTNHVYIDKVNHTNVSAELLKRLYKITNRNTIAGRRIAELLRIGGFGKFVDEERSSFIGYTETIVVVSDINATADSSNEVASSVVGETVGKGFGYDEKASNRTFSYENDEFGYWVTIQALVPNSGYCQSIDQTLYDLDRYDYYTSEMDGLGMEFSRKTVVYGAQDWTNPYQDDYKEYDDSFGVVPRYSRYKTVPNIANGDFTLRGTRDGLLPYILDKFINIDDRYVKDVSGGDRELYKTYRINHFSSLPIAGNAWRYNSRYSWLNNFERIFASFLTEYGGYPASIQGQFATLVKYEYLSNAYDSFIVLNRLNMVGYCPMLAIEDSYGTLDDNEHSDTALAKA